MLILTRRIGERLCIGDDVSISVLGFKGNQVRLGISAPREVPVDRAEVYVRKRAERTPPAPAQARLPDPASPEG